MASRKEEETVELEFQPKKFDLGFGAVFDKILESVVSEFKNIKYGRQDVDDVESLRLSALVRVEAKLKCLLLQKLEFQSRSVPLKETVEEAESALLEMKRSEEERFDFLPLNMQLEQHIAKSKLLLEEMGLIRLLGAESPMLEMHLKEHISNLESLLEKLEREECTLEPPVLRIELIEELKFLLGEMKIHPLLLKPLEETVKEAESALLEMKRRSEKEGFDFSPLEVQLEQHIAKSQLLLEEMGMVQARKAKFPMLEKHVKEHISNVESLLEKLEREESTVESSVLRRELIEELKFLLEELKIESMLLEPSSLVIEYMMKRILFLEKTKLEQKKGERSQMSEMELKRSLEELIFLSKKISRRGEYGREEYSGKKCRRERYLRWEYLRERYLREDNWRVEYREWQLMHIFFYRESDLLTKMKWHGVESTINQLRENVVDFEPLLKTIVFPESNDKLRLLKLRIELDIEMVKLQRGQERLDEKEVMRVIKAVEKSVNVLEEMKLKQRGKEDIAKFKEHREDHESLLRSNISVYWNIVDQKGKLEYLLQEMKKMQETLSSEIILNERHIEEIEHRLEEVGRWERLPFPALVDELLSCKFPEDQIESKREVGKAKARLRAMKVKLEQEMHGFFSSLKKEREEPKMHIPDDFPTVTEIDLKRKEKQSVASSTGEQKPPSTLDESQDVIVIGGCDQYGESLRSVEGYQLPDGTSFEFPAMNKSRSFMACVVDGQNVIVSGGQSDGHTITCTIEGLNSAQTPLRWEVYDFRLRVGLCGHAMVVHAGKLIVVGGFDDSTGENSDEIYEIPLTPPHRARYRNFLPQPRAGHGVVLANGKIFIFGGGRNPWSHTDDVWVYNISQNRCCAINNLPYPVQGMATIRTGNTVMLLGGSDEEDDEMRDVISYDIESGKISYCCNVRFSYCDCNILFN